MSYLLNIFFLIYRFLLLGIWLKIVNIKKAVNDQTVVGIDE